MKQCILCDRTERTHRIAPTTGLCNPCEVALVYWKKKTPTQIIKRANQISSFQNRMEVLLGNVKTIKRRKRA
jgi:hypothetical protein